MYICTSGAFNPPKVAGKDDVTGDDLVQHEDVKEVNVLQESTL
jgi:hypothetical protein